MFGYFKSRKQSKITHDLYSIIVAQSREPFFYTDLGVADTVDGRFDMIVLHLHLALNRMKAGDEEAQAISQALFDLMFADMDRNLREMGVGDIGVSHRIKAMAEAYFGRATVYAEALRKNDNQELTSALKRNLYRKTAPQEEQIEAMAQYVRQQIDYLLTQEIEALKRGKIDFSMPREEG